MRGEHGLDETVVRVAGLGVRAEVLWDRYRNRLPERLRRSAGPSAVRFLPEQAGPQSCVCLVPFGITESDT